MLIVQLFARLCAGFFMPGRRALTEPAPPERKGYLMAKIEGGITWGNVWSIGATIVAVAVSYATLQAGLLEGQREMKRIELQGGQATQELRLTHEKQLTDIRADLVTHRQSIQQLEISDARNSERYEALSRSMDELKAAQRETNDLLRQITSQRNVNSN